MSGLALKASAAFLALAATAVTTNAAVIVSDFDPGGTYNGGTEGWFPYGTAGISAISNPTGGTSTWASH